MSFWKKQNHHKRLKSLPKANARDHSNRNRRTHLSASGPGSLTLEAAVVIPFTAAFWVSLLLIIRILQIETAVQESLTYAGRWCAVEASAVEAPAAVEASAMLLARKEMSRYPVIDRYVYGGSLPGVILKADGKSDLLTLEADYFVKIPMGFFGFQGIRITQSANQRKWTGKDPVREAGAAGDNPDVYFTDYGRVYHLSADCKYLNPTIQTTSCELIGYLRSRDGGKYYPCASCGGEGEMVYYTPYGGAYHSSLECSGLKRTIHVASKDQMGGMPACSSCGKGH